MDDRAQQLTEHLAAFVFTARQLVVTCGEIEQTQAGGVAVEKAIAEHWPALDCWVRSVVEAAGALERVRATDTDETAGVNSQKKSEMAKTMSNPYRIEPDGTPV